MPQYFVPTVTTSVPDGIMLSAPTPTAPNPLPFARSALYKVFAGSGIREEDTSGTSGSLSGGDGQPFPPITRYTPVTGSVPTAARGKDATHLEDISIPNRSFATQNASKLPSI